MQIERAGVPSDVVRTQRRTVAASGARVWLTALLAGVAVAWPLVFAALLYGPAVLTHGLIGDSYHYLAIARKAVESGRYTYDGVHVTNGFHPLWEYSIRTLYTALHLRDHASQGVAVMLLALAATTAGVMLASAAVVRMTGRRFLGLLLVPGLFYLLAGVHVQTQWVWSTIIGMESAFSVLFGGAFFFVVSRYFGLAAGKALQKLGGGETHEFALIPFAREVGLVLPLLILSRLDDIFLLPALLVAVWLFVPRGQHRVRAGVWLSGPSVLAVAAYVIYNKATVGAGMPLSGGTKSGFVGALTAYLTAAVHFPPLMNLRAHFTHTPVDGATVFASSFRFVEVAYPLVMAAFSALAIWRYRRRSAEYLPFFAVCLYVVFKCGYNFLMVHPWHQAAWYYGFTSLSLSVMGAVLLRSTWEHISECGAARAGLLTVYAGLMLLTGSQYYATIVFPSADDQMTARFWQRHDALRAELVAHGVTGLINHDDGITAFLLDMPSMHGFAFATDVEAQRAHREGRMLTLASARGINTLTGFGYMAADAPPQNDAELRAYLRKSIAFETMRAEMDRFDFRVAYYDPVLKMVFVSFQPR